MSDIPMRWRMPCGHTEVMVDSPNGPLRCCKEAVDCHGYDTDATIIALVAVAEAGEAFDGANNGGFGHWSMFNKLHEALAAFPERRN